MKFKLFIFSLLSFLVLSCTKLVENLQGEVEQNNSGTITPAQILSNAYLALDNPLQDQSRFWAAQEHTTDEAIGPTRGPDWDDNGVWRVLHSHSWNADHAFLRDTYREL